MKKVINLYVTKGCSKCEILQKECEKSEVIKNSDFQISVIDANDTNDTDLQLLLEHGLTMFPVLLVDNTFLNFENAMHFVRTGVIY